MVQLLQILNIALLSACASASPTSCPDGLCLMTRANISPAQVAQELGPLLSSEASIFGPNDTRFAEANENWTDFGRPTFTVVVEAGRESDISTIVSLLDVPILESEQLC